MHQRLLSVSALCLAVAALAAGCTSSAIPLSQNFEQTSQYKVRSAQHWHALSADAADRTVQTLESIGVTQAAPFYVALPEQPSKFDLAFRDMITTDLVERGAAVQSQPQGSQFYVVYNAQVVPHKSNLALEHLSSPGPGYSAQTGTELVLTTSVINQGRFVSRTTDVYYLENIDAGLYDVGNQFNSLNMKVVSQ
ncbi:hypothetical protein E8K88_00225 [Lampropedia aestuarii]|uniref:Uncharacterized protein n=1 Tax=Lampropedia aestuarii TaxID=2562762 RepID=A0A4S5BY48_9BURK|nr:hypothetical protein [Lampropedia aestuarii]MDH5856780.1 hypothetical protein [Lampropedia aestuarii]THJ36373.1 hypothetical protein E8K88_00225 [Lampropedia aestuarii]